ncbi:alcohol dehydrogenase catalytic domain-containing protein [Winkia neuii]|uniref:alcohol dehydrogenase catalytic domain-containing protein n=1 Tax=Winkia neuii TaxID=33007 RepID=UPI0023A9FD9A|nr:alcohol dehydrogenase catalytic domain-containing protein [Winkia neuii]WEB72549.1 alcohol dehydrogenase catalytic domain-containing protein [Winkia neuii]
MATYDIPKTMRANVLLGQQQMRMEERPVPTPSPGQLLIKVLSVGVCGSDVHYYRTGECAGFKVEEPLILGHEASGIVVAAGSAEDEARIGERSPSTRKYPDANAATARQDT